tara:strand:+ start:1643 stop:3670 length:2028 start_codon:yes stop_codon:yes gene_type:complete
MTIQTDPRDIPSYSIRLKGLDETRTMRIYKTLSQLSTQAVNALKQKNMKSFSLYTDNMRPLMSYVTFNFVKITDHLETQDIDNTLGQISEKDGLKELVSNLRQNLKIIKNASAAIASIPFSPIVFSSEEVTNAFLDNFLPLAWDFEYDLIILMNLDDPSFLRYLTARGQKKLFLIGGSLDRNILDEELDKNGVSFWFNKDASIVREMMESINGRPPVRIIYIDCGLIKSDPAVVKKMSLDAQHGKSAAWQRFNTINRADSVKVFDNLFSLHEHTQTSELHDKFKGKAAIIVCPGPSLQKNINVLKKLQGKAIIICVLHALRTLQTNNIKPDIVIHIDPENLKEKIVEKNGKETTKWEQWLVENDLSKVDYFITSFDSPSEIFNLPVKQIMWMNPAIPLSKYLPLSIFDYRRVGGSVSHAAFDLAIEFGCSAVVLVGQDLAYADTGEMYTKAASLGNKRGDEFIKSNFGNDIEAKGHDGGKVITNEVFLTFANLYSHFAKELDGLGPKLFNCTEGGMFIEGFQHCKLEEFIDKQACCSEANKFDEIYSRVRSEKEVNKKNPREILKFIGKNIRLTEEIATLMKKVNPLLRKNVKTEDDIAKFNKLQNKIIKIMAKNYFYSLALQKDIYILKSGTKADNTVDGQFGFHENFLGAAEAVNQKFRNSLIKQKNLFLSIN